MKLPSLKQQPVGEYQSGHIQQPNYAAKYDAIGDLISASGSAYAAYRTAKTVNGIDEASGTAANELSELRAKLENTKVMPANEVPDDVITELQTSVIEKAGGRKEISKPFVYTHEVADEIWQKQSQAIIDHHASTIKHPEARAKFIGEMTERYQAPGTGAIIKANILRAKAYGQAQAERAIENIISSNAPREVREVEAKEAIARQALLGADPVWVERMLSSLGPTIDQMDVHNDIIAATTLDQIDQIEEVMYTGGTRMSPEQMRTMSGIMDKRRADFEKDRRNRQTETADQMYAALYRQELTLQQVEAAVSTDGITNEDSQVMYNALTKGSVAKASDPFVLSQYQGAIQVIQYTGNQHLVLQRQKLLRLVISRAAVGLNPNGTPSGLPSRITGADAFKLNAELDRAVESALENNEYDNALRSLVSWTGVRVDLEGQIYAGIGGDQNTVNAALEFKQGLDTYMNQYGADAKPQEYFDANKDAFSPNNFAAGINKEFRDQVPEAANFMTEVVGGIGEFTFTEEDQNLFERWLGANATTMDPEAFRKVQVLFDQYYRGRGIAPEGGRLQLEPADPLYFQFEALIQ